MTVLAQWLKNDAGNSLSDMPTEVKKTYKDTVEAVKPKNQENNVDEWKKMNRYFHVETARLAICAGEELLRRSLDFSVP